MSDKKQSLLADDALSQSIHAHSGHAQAQQASSKVAVLRSDDTAPGETSVHLGDHTDGDGGDHSDGSFAQSHAEGLHEGLHASTAVAPMQKYRKRARRSRRAQRIQQQQSEGLPLRHADADVSDSEEQEEETRYRVAAYCTCDTYHLAKLYHFMTTRARSAVTAAPVPAISRASSNLAQQSLPSVRSTRASASDLTAAAAAAAAAAAGAGAGGVGSGVSHVDAGDESGAPRSLQQVLELSRVSLTFFGSDVVQIKIRTEALSMQKHAFVFEYGCLACFNCTPAEEAELVAMLARFEEDPLTARERKAGVEHMEYVYGSHSHVSNDTVMLAGDASLEKLSVAFAMAQCVKLNVFEERIDQEIEKSKELPEALAKTGSIGLTRNEMAKKIGKLFIERNNVNLHADILDDPEFFWEQDRYKHVYEKLFKYLELGKRVGLLNKRLGILKELFDMVADQLEVAHSEKLEYIIIYLIVVEVVVMVGWQILIKDVLGFFNHGH